MAGPPANGATGFVAITRTGSVFDFAIPGEYSARMEQLHAPWRIEYLLAPKPKLEESLFTRIAQSDDDAANLIVARDRTCYARSEERRVGKECRL